jgi:hypothetical protein
MSENPRLGSRKIVGDYVTGRFSVAGTSFAPNGVETIGRLRALAPLTLRRDPKNKYDKNAIQVLYLGHAVGFVPRQLAAEWAPLLDSGVKIEVQRCGHAMDMWGVMAYRYKNPEIKNEE